MRRKFITKNYTFAGYVGVTLWLFILLGLFTVNMQSKWLFMVLPLWFIGAGVHVYSNYRRLNERNDELRWFAEAHHYGYNQTTPLRFLQRLGSLDELHQARDFMAKNIIDGDGWQYADVSYRLYGKTKNGEYVKAVVYYGVMIATLPRQMPNVFFDSKKARRRQFRLIFSKAQLHSLEGDFDKYFATYFPEQYTIDSMSFISPDTMLALRDAADYDIEIIGDRLLLYGPLFDPGQQLPDMIKKLDHIKKELLDNILTYRDERLPYAFGRRMVDLQGAALKRNPFWKIVSITVGAFAVGYIILILVQAIVEALL